MTLSDPKRLETLMTAPKAVALWQALQPLRSCVSFMNTGAHPDDETTPMLAALALRDGVKISQACANRGEGGQNVIGHETGAALGTVRTREMERAAEVINMTHYWLSQSPDDSIFDFAFSKSGDETLRIWGEARTLARFVEIIRQERPDIICPTFLDIPGQHGHHQAMTRAAFKAVKMAADPSVLPELGLDPWQIKKLYLPAWSGAGDAYDDDVPPPKASVVIDATGSDPVLGADYAQIAQYSRSFHRTQGMGSWVEPGLPSTWPLHLAWAESGQTGPEASIFESLPKTLADLSGFAKAPELSDALNSVQTELDKAILAWPESAKIQAHAQRALKGIASALENCPPHATAEITHRLDAKTRQLSQILLLLRGDQPRVSLSQTNVRPGEVVTLRVHGISKDTTAHAVVPEGWQVESSNKNTFEIKVSPTASASDPYPDIWHPDRANDPLRVRLSWDENGTQVRVSLDPEERLIVQPDRSAILSTDSAILNVQSLDCITLDVSEVHPKGATVDLDPQPGWATTREQSQFTLTPKPDISEGLYQFNLTLDGAAAQTMHLNTYPHTGTTQLCQPARLTARVLDVTLPAGRIAYIGGGNDSVDTWLRKAGLEVETLMDDAMQAVDLADYDSILVGVFALRTCPQLAARLADIHAWVHAGGNLVTLYHRPWDNWDVDTTALAPLTIGKPSLRWRVTDQNAKVRHLAPDHALLTTPNQITDADWQGWFKERGLYFAAKWDSAYTPILEMADPDEAPLQGAMVSGRFGKGRHTHTSLILHHQLQNLVPGAYRILANLLHNPNK